MMMRLLSIDSKTKAKTYELTPNESIASHRFDELLDEGHSCTSAYEVIRKEFQSRVSETFLTWLIEG